MPRVGPLEQLVEVRNYGVGFGLPKEWATIEADDIDLPNPGPELQEAARRSGMTPEQLARIFSEGGIQTMSVAERDPDETAPDFVLTAGVPGGSLTDAQLKRRLTRRGATLGPLRHLTTPVGDATAVSLYVVKDRRPSYSSFLVVDLGDTAVGITVTSVNWSRPSTIEQEIVRTLQFL